jgi:hypothetical protein
LCAICCELRRTLAYFSWLSAAVDFCSDPGIIKPLPERLAMSAKPYTYRESDAARAVRVAKKAGLKVTGLRVDHNGVTVIVEGTGDKPAPASNPWDKKGDSDAGGPAAPNVA